MTTFYLIRHGEPLRSLADERRLRGGMRGLIPLTSMGCEQIERLSTELRPLQGEIIIASPMTRALQSAAILSRLLDLPLSVEFDLHEWVLDLSYTYDQWAQEWAALPEVRRLDGEWPAGETRNWEPWSVLRQRVIKTLQRYTTWQRVLVVCHGGMIGILGGPRLDPACYCTYELEAA